MRNKVTRRLIVIAAAAAVAGVVLLNLPSDRTLRAMTDGAGLSVSQIEEETGNEEEAPAEETMELVIPAETDEPAAEEPADGLAAEEPAEDPEAGEGEGSSDTENAPNVVELSAEKTEEIPEDPESPADDPEAAVSPTEIRATASDGTRVVVQASEGVLPAGAYVEIRPLEPDDEENPDDAKLADEAREAVLGELSAGEEITEAKIYDITIFDADGVEIIPDDRMTISILGAEIDAGDEASVYHVGDNGKAEKVADAPDTSNVSFHASND